MEKKVCTKCKEEKDVTEFNSSRNQCKLCRKEYDKEYNQNNKENIKERKKEYYQNNKEKFKERHKEYKKNNRERVKKLNANYMKLKKLSDTLFKVRGNISNAAAIIKSFLSDIIFGCFTTFSFFLLSSFILLKKSIKVPKIS
jgi:hypothetical protein